MKKSKLIFTLRKMNLLLLIFFGIILILGSGFTLLSLIKSKAFQIIFLSYITALIFTIKSRQNPKFLWPVLIAWCIFTLANIIDIKNTANANNDLCQELRANKTCVEDECGFTCSDVGGGIGLTTSASICKDKDMNLCTQKRNSTK